MKLNLSITILLVMLAMCAACSSGKQERSVEEINEVVSAKAAEKKVAETGPVTMGRLTEKSRSTAPDGSEIIISTDEFGNQVSVRSVSGNERVSAINVQELADGRVIVSVIGKDGTRVEVPPHLKNAALVSHPDDFATLAGFADVPVNLGTDTTVPASSDPKNPGPSTVNPESATVASGPQNTPSEISPATALAQSPPVREDKSGSITADTGKTSQADEAKLKQIQRDLSGLVSKISHP